MLRKMVLTAILVAVCLALTVSALGLRGQPSFGEEAYADGQTWGTKVTTQLPPPRGNLQSFDKFFVITNSNNPGVQLPVGEAAPRNPDYNGGRWITYTIEWTALGFFDHGIVPILKSYEDIKLHAGLGHLLVVEGSPPGGPPPYFQCPLLPTK